MSGRRVLLGNELLRELQRSLGASTDIALFQEANAELAFVTSPECAIYQRPASAATSSGELATLVQANEAQSQGKENHGPDRQSEHGCLHRLGRCATAFHAI